MSMGSFINYVMQRELGRARVLGVVQDHKAWYIKVLSQGSIIVPNSVILFMNFEFKN